MQTSRLQQLNWDTLVSMLGNRSRLLSLFQSTLHTAVKRSGSPLTVVARVDFRGLVSLFRFHEVDPGKLESHWQYMEEPRSAE